MRGGERVLSPVASVMREPTLHLSASVERSLRGPGTSNGLYRLPTKDMNTILNTPLKYGASLLPLPYR